MRVATVAAAAISSPMPPQSWIVIFAARRKGRERPGIRTPSRRADHTSTPE